MAFDTRDPGPNGNYPWWPRDAATGEPVYQRKTTVRRHGIRYHLAFNHPDGIPIMLPSEQHTEQQHAIAVSHGKA